MEKKEIEIIELSDDNIQSMIYVVRGQRVMLDFELAEIYGYETKNFNRQVKNNVKRFEGDEFMFELSKEEFEEILRCKNFTSSWGGTRYLPKAFTEQGIYMLMTVLKGELAIRQSRMLIRIFKRMKDYILDNQGLIGSDEIARLSLQTAKNTSDIAEIKDKMVTKAELSDFIKKFDEKRLAKDYVILNGHIVDANLAYSEIYSLAKKTIYVVDNYINLKTLSLLKSAREGTKITIFSDNIKNGLRLSDYKDFLNEYKSYSVSLKRTEGKYHDRYIVLDYGLKSEKIYHCGASSKDAGKRTTSISLSDNIKLYRPMINELLLSPELILS